MSSPSFAWLRTLLIGLAIAAALTFTMFVVSHVALTADDGMGEAIRDGGAALVLFVGVPGSLLAAVVRQLNASR